MFQMSSQALNGGLMFFCMPARRSVAEEAVGALVGYDSRKNVAMFGYAQRLR